MGLFQVVHTITLTLPHHLTSDELQELEELTFAHFLAREGTDPRTSTIKHADWPITLKTVTSQHLVHPGGGGSSNSSASSRRASPMGPRARTSSRGSTATSKSFNGQAAKAPSPVPSKVPSVAPAEEVPVRPASRAASAVPSAVPKEKTRPASHLSVIGGPAAGSKAPSRASNVAPSKPASAAAAAPSKGASAVPDQLEAARPTSRAPSAAAEEKEVEAPAPAQSTGDKPLPHPPSGGDSRPPSVAPSNALGLRFSPLQPQAASVAAGEIAAAGQGSRAGSRAGSVVGDPPKVPSVKDDTGSVVAGRGEGGSKVLSPIKEAVTPAPPPAPTPVPAPAPSAHGSVPIPKAASAAASKVANEVKVPSAAGISRQPSLVKLAPGGQPQSVAASVAAHELCLPSVRAATAASAHGSKRLSAPAASAVEGTVVPKSVGQPRASATKVDKQNKSVPAPPPSVPHTNVERKSPAVPTINAPPAERKQSFPPGRQVIEEFTTLEISLKAEWGEDALGTARIKELVGVCLSELEMMARRLEQKKNAVDNAPMSAVP